MSTYLLSCCIHKVQPVRLNGGLFEGECIIYCLYAGGQGVGGIEDIVCRVLGYFFVVEQLVCDFFVYGITVLVADMAIDVKREMMLSTFGMPFFSLSLSRIILLKLNHEV